MAEIDIGSHCQYAQCKQLDFLPITCGWCKEDYCRQHSAPDQHNCSKYGEEAASGEYSGQRAYSCSVHECEQRELTPIECEACHKNFCLSHRHQVDHSCENLEVPSQKMCKTAQHVQNIIESKKYPVRKAPSKKARAMAAKVALMKLKMKATGDKGIPDAEKIYFHIILPLGSKTKAKPLVFSRKWTVGKVIDYTADAASLQNKNNIVGAKKLKLFDCDSGNMYPADLTVERLLTEGYNQLFNGSSLILEYVNSAVSALDNIDVYNT